ncbi:hypothetical protein [Ectobacillus sp. sgz5001026]|uniref:hypothetical protein n=1 Tax=Ectobacillus sp. sgz5001026 TaxID=3242473 RepID=UPI0036D30319
MVANINLLPKQQKEGSSSRILILILSIVFLGLGAATYVKMQQINSQTTDLSKQLAVAKVKVETQQKTAASTTSTVTGADLEKSAKALADGQIKLLPVLIKMTSFLPGRGVFVSFVYKDPNTITTEIRFDDKQAAAYYFSRLGSEPWIQEAKLSSIKAQDVQSQNQQVTSNPTPRYIAQYVLVVNKDKVKELEKEGKQ